jgi:hypothetical protein
MSSASRRRSRARSLLIARFVNFCAAIVTPTHNSVLCTECLDAIRYAHAFNFSIATSE